MDQFEERLRDAGLTVAEQPRVGSALGAVVAGRTRQRRLHVLASVGVGVLALGGVGAAAASGAFGPWSLQNPSLSYTRDWSDADGNYLGTCETRIRVDLLPTDVRPVVEEYLATHDLGSLEPHWEEVAGLLVATGRAERFPALHPGDEVTNYNITHTGEPWDAEVWTDARILQSGLDRAVSLAVNQELFARMPELENRGIRGSGEVQCSTDPDWLVELRGTWPDDPSA